RVFVGASGVPERNIVEFEVATNRRHPDQARLRWVLLWLRVEYVIETLERDIYFLKLTPQVDHIQNGEGNVPNQQIEGHQLTNRELSVDYQMGAIPEKKNNIQHLQEIAD